MFYIANFRENFNYLVSKQHSKSNIMSRGCIAQPFVLSWPNMHYPKKKKTRKKWTFSVPRMGLGCTDMGLLHPYAEQCNQVYKFCHGHAKLRLWHPMRLLWAAMHNLICYCHVVVPIKKSDTKILCDQFFDNTAESHHQALKNLYKR